MANRPTRRDLLAGTGAALSLAGCLGEGADADGEPGDDSTTADDRGWRETPLEDVTTGDSFTIAEIDRPVVVHTFTLYCPTCENQQEEIAESRDAVGDDAAFVDLAIEGGDDADGVRDHVEENGYGWRFAVASEAFTGDLVDEFGREIGIHAQSPLVVACPDGSTDTLEKGASASAIREAVDGCR